MDISSWSRKDIGAYGEKIAAHYLRNLGFWILDRNVARKTGELDVIARKGRVLHFVEVKTVVRREFPITGSLKDVYDPSANLHALKLRRVARTGEWYAAEKRWNGDMQVDAVLVWLRERDGVAKVTYLPQIL